MKLTAIVTYGMIALAGSAALVTCVWQPTHADPQTTHASDGVRIFYDKIQGRVRYRAVLVPKQQFEIEKAKTIAREFLDSSRSSVLSELLVGYDQHDLETGKLGTVPRPESDPNICETLTQLRQGYEQTGQPVSPIARVITIENSSLFSFREAGFGNPNHSGVQETVLAGGRDPTKAALAGGQYRLLTFATNGKESEGFLSLVLFFKSSASPSCSACGELARRFQRVTAAQEVEVQIRMDTWFADLHFPLFFRFEPDDQPVTYEDWNGRIGPPKVTQYYKAPHAMCHLNGSAFTCDAYGRYDHVP